MKCIYNQSDVDSIISAYLIYAAFRQDVETIKEHHAKNYGSKLVVDKNLETNILFIFTDITLEEYLAVSKRADAVVLIANKLDPEIEKRKDNLPGYIVYDNDSSLTYLTYLWLTINATGLSKLVYSKLRYPVKELEPVSNDAKYINLYFSAPDWISFLDLGIRKNLHKNPSSDVYYLCEAIMDSYQYGYVDDTISDLVDEDISYKSLIEEQKSA